MSNNYSEYNNEHRIKYLRFHTYSYYISTANATLIIIAYLHRDNCMVSRPKTLYDFSASLKVKLC